MEIITETISDEEEDWGGILPHIPHPSKDWDADVFRRTITVE